MKKLVSFAIPLVLVYAAFEFANRAQSERQTSLVQAMNEVESILQKRYAKLPLFLAHQRGTDSSNPAIEPNPNAFMHLPLSAFNAESVPTRPNASPTEIAIEALKVLHEKAASPQQRVFAIVSLETAVKETLYDSARQNSLKSNPEYVALTLDMRETESAFLGACSTLDQQVVHYNSQLASLFLGNLAKPYGWQPIPTRVNAATASWSSFNR